MRQKNWCALNIFFCIFRGRNSRLPEEATAKPSGLNEVVSTDDISGEVLLVGVELEVKQQLGEPLLAAYTLAEVSAPARVDGEPDDFAGVRSRGAADDAAASSARGGGDDDVPSSSAVDSVGDALGRLRGDGASLLLLLLYSGLSAVRLKPGEITPFFRSLLIVVPFENLLHRLTNDWVMVAMAICVDMVVTVFTWFSSAASDVV